MACNKNNVDVIVLSAIKALLFGSARVARGHPARPVRGFSSAGDPYFCSRQHRFVCPSPRPRSAEGISCVLGNPFLLIPRRGEDPDGAHLRSTQSMRPRATDSVAPDHGGWWGCRLRLVEPTLLYQTPSGHRCGCTISMVIGSEAPQRRR